MKQYSSCCAGFNTAQVLLSVIVRQHSRDQWGHHSAFWVDKAARLQSGMGEYPPGQSAAQNCDIRRHTCSGSVRLRMQVAPLPPAAPHVLFGRGSDKQDSGGQAPTAERLARLDELTGVGKKLRRRTGQSQGSGSEAGGEPLDPAARLQVVQVSICGPKRHDRSHTTPYKPLTTEGAVYLVLRGKIKFEFPRCTCRKTSGALPTPGGIFWQLLPAF